MAKVVFNFNKLKGKIVEVYGTNSKFSKALGVSERTLSLKLSSKIHWRSDEIFATCNLLGISAEEISIYFFVPEVKDL